MKHFYKILHLTKLLSSVTVINDILLSVNSDSMCISCENNFVSTCETTQP